MKSGTRTAIVIAALLSGMWHIGAQSTSSVVSPTSLNFTYQVNSSTFPAPAKLTATLPTSMSTVQMLVKANSPSPQGAGWLAVTPDSGRSPLALTVTVNPTGLAPGNYPATITISTPAPYSTSTTVQVNLSISNPPSALVVTSSSSYYTAVSATAGTLAFDYTTGTSALATAEIDVASNGDVIPFNVTAAGAGKSTGSSGSANSSVWLRVNQTGQLPNLTTSGVALSGSYVPITVSLDLTTVKTLDPGSYTQTVTIAANNAANGSFVVTVTLVVSAGAPILDPTVPIFPASVIASPSIDPVITLYGDNFFSTSVVAMQLGSNPAVTLTSKLLSRKVLQATIKASYLAAPTDPSTTYPISWTISVTNPATASSPAPAPATTTLLVTDPKQPSITWVVNSASFLQTAAQPAGTNPVSPGATSVSPREIISIFGQNLGPTAATPVPPTGTPSAYPTVYASSLTDPNVQVEFQIPGVAASVYAPLIMISSNQINCIVPVEVASVIGTATPTVDIQVDYGTNHTVPFPVTVVSEDPGIFTFGGLGQGQGAILNFDASTGSYTINSSKTAALKGSAISIYATGLGDLAGNMVFAVTDSSVPAVTVTKLLPLTVDALGITTAALPAGVVTVAYTPTSIQAAGGKTPYTWSATGLPAGLTQNAASGAITGTTATPGIFNVTITVSDSSSPAKSASKNYSLVIGPSLTIATTALPDGAVSSAYTAPDLQAQGGTAPYIWTATPATLPPGVTLSATGQWGGTPTTAGSYMVGLTVTDSAGTPSTATASLQLVIDATLTITTTSLSNAITGATYAAALTAVGGTPPYHWTATGLPTGLALDPDTGALTGTPASTVATALPNGVLAEAAIRLSDNTCRVDIDGQPAVVTYAGTAWGAVAGLVQINAVVPPTVKTGAAIPIVVSIGPSGQARRSQSGVTLGVK